MKKVGGSLVCHIFRAAAVSDKRRVHFHRLCDGRPGPLRVVTSVGSTGLGVSLPGIQRGQRLSLGVHGGSSREGAESHMAGAAREEGWRPGVTRLRPGPFA